MKGSPHEHLPINFEFNTNGVNKTIRVIEIEGEPWFVAPDARSEEHTSELQSPALISYAVFCLDRKSVV